MGTGHQLKYKWTMFALDALLTAVTKRITNSNLLMNRLVGWNIILNILKGTRHKHSESKTQSEPSLALWVESFILTRYAFPVRTCLSSHTFWESLSLPLSVTQFGKESSWTAWSGSHDLRGLGWATSTQIPLSAWCRCPSGLPPLSTSTSSPANQS